MQISELIENAPENEAVSYILNLSDLNELDENGYAPLHWSALYDKAMIAQVLISKGADVNVRDIRGNSPLYLAAASGNLATASVLLNNRALTDPDRLENPLHGAILYEHADLVDLLLNLGMKVDRTSIHLAIQAGNSKILKQLLANDIDINMTNEDGENVLYNAAGEGNIEIVVLLLENGINANHVSNSFETALHNAAAWGNLEVAQLLVKYGVDPNLIDDDGKKAINYAQENGHDEVEQFLKSLDT